jgi:hypothetical protein
VVRLVLVVRFCVCIFLLGAVAAGGYTVPGGVTTGGVVPGCPTALLPTAGVAAVLLGSMGTPGAVVVPEVVPGVVVWASTGPLHKVLSKARPNR